MNPAEFEKFLTDNRLTHKEWEAAKITLPDLLSISDDHKQQMERLRDSAEFFARVIQRFDLVHSVRWRIKSTEHLLAKIIRKRAAGIEKYKDISSTNYFEIVTDLVGIRALHLFKDDCFPIDVDLRRTLGPFECTIAYIRTGDPDDLTKRFEDSGFKIKEHSAGYRSVHYVFKTRPLQRTVFAELQVRTIFEEGWSEIDHRVRYPSFSDHEQVGYFLTIFNRLAGSADEMGSFVRGLTAALQTFRSNIADATKEKEDALKAMDCTLRDLEKLKEQDAVAKKKLSELQTEVNRLRATPSLESFLLGTNRNPLVGLNSLHTKTLIIGDDKALGKMESGGTVGLLGSSINDNLLIGNPSNKKCF
jgi:ppGpp synthetase/RelA/SpoT-type nucleotidyltranferase